MNNLFKIFLIFNLVSSVASQVNNYSQPLSETELTVGQNSSELVKQEEPLILHGGFGVTKISVDKGGIPCQRSCTLSFPVYTSYSSLGFLASGVCTGGGDIFINDTKVGDSGFSTIISGRGLDYALVQVYSDHWSNEVSRKIPYSQCSNTVKGIINADMLMPIIDTPSQPPLPNFKVYAYGGDSGIVSGVIKEFGVEIQTPTPWQCGKNIVALKNVTKVLMNKPYSFGDLGAPVYIPVQIPNSTQLVANPVGQVVENVGGGSEENIWYYIPLDRILEDSGLGLAVTRP